MKITPDDITLTPLRDNDMLLFEKWLNKEYVYKRLCPDGEEEKAAWLEEVANKAGTYDFQTHFIICHNDRKIGYCLYADCFFMKDDDYAKGVYDDVPAPNHTYEIGYLIGDEEFLNKGVAKTAIRMLQEKIAALGGHEISADPSEENTFSIKALLSNGFHKKRDGDYRKPLKTGHTNQ